MSDAQNSLDRHNQARASKGVQPLQWDDQLANDAEAYAQKLASMNTLQHSGVVSENLAWTSDDCTFDRAVGMWLDEEKNYNGERIGEGNFMSYGHYTQCMWSGTTRVGMGRAQTGDGATFVVGIYNPDGNITGMTPY